MGRLMKIMIVDDSEDMGLLIQSMLQSAGYTDFLQARSASEAFKLLGIDENGKANNDVPASSRQAEKENEQLTVDLILMDIVMPEIDGIEACQTIHASKQYSDTPLIMVTARHEADDLETAFYAGALFYITKPLKRVELLARVHSALRLKEEIDRFKARERQLEEARQEIKRLRAMLRQKARKTSFPDKK